MSSGGTRPGPYWQTRARVTSKRSDECEDARNRVTHQFPRTGEAAGISDGVSPLIVECSWGRYVADPALRPSWGGALFWPQSAEELKGRAQLLEALDTSRGGSRARISHGTKDATIGGDLAERRKTKIPTALKPLGSNWLPGLGSNQRPSD